MPAPRAPDGAPVALGPPPQADASEDPAEAAPMSLDAGRQTGRRADEQTGRRAPLPRA